MNELAIYVSRIKEFNQTDWKVYIIWIGMMFGLFAVVLGFMLFGTYKGVVFPNFAWNVPIGNFIFSLAIAIDTIGHRTVYKNEIAIAEALVHHVTIFCGISSVVLLCLCLDFGDFFWIPAIVLTFLSFFFSFIDEAMHWQRYISKKSDRVEMWSHAFILIGHGIMMLSWWIWYFKGYSGVQETLEFWNALQ